MTQVASDAQRFITGLNFAEKVERAKKLLGEAYSKHGNGLVVAHSMGKDSCVVWDLAKEVVPSVRGFCVTTRHKPRESKLFMAQVVEAYPELEIFENRDPIPDRLFRDNPDLCCQLLKVKPTRRALLTMGATCWVTGIRCTEGSTRKPLAEVEQRGKLTKVNPILVWHEREVWQYLALKNIPVNPLYAQGYRSLGCKPCSSVVASEDERAGRWVGTAKRGGECGIHTETLLE
jgi:phosphoadenosine phosphosulfate reductase